MLYSSPEHQGNVLWASGKRLFRVHISVVAFYMSYGEVTLAAEKLPRGLAVQSDASCPLPLVWAVNVSGSAKTVEIQSCSFGSASVRV